MNNKIRILALFLHDSLWGRRIRGDERRFLELAKRFKKFGANLYVVEFAPSLQKSYYDIPVYQSIELQSRRFVYLLSYIVLLALRFKNYDAIYVNNQDLYNVIAALILRLIRRRPLIVVVQSLQDIELPLRTLKVMYRSSVLDLLFICIHRILLYILFIIANAIVTTTKYLKSSLIMRFPYAERKVFVTGNGVDLSKFRPINVKKKYDAIFLGRVHVFHKGIDKLLLAWRIIRNILPNAKLIIVGGYESDMDQRLLFNMLDKLALRKNVIVAGFVEDEEVVTLLNSSKIFISLSVYEGFGLSLLEAMACGLPCIVPKLEVFRELHKDLLLYVNARDYRDVATRIHKLLLYDFNQNILKNVYEHVKRFSWEAVAYKELLLIRNLIHAFKS